MVMGEPVKDIKGYQSDTLRFKIKIDVGIVKFLFLFITSITTFYFISVTFEPLIPLFNEKSTANILFIILKNLGIESTLKNNTINFQNFSVIVIDQCTGIFELISLFSCILAYPVKLKSKFIGILAIIPLIYSLNMTRLLFLSFLGIYSSSLFNIFHKYVFQVTFVSIVIIIWTIWIDVVKKYEK
jgi:archaeosortase B (VPXXXP-CTERM-specific)